MSISINQKLCPQNHICPAIESCPVGALTQIGFAAPKIDKEKCINCGTCVNICPKGALQFED